MANFHPLTPIGKRRFRLLVWLGKTPGKLMDVETITKKVKIHRDTARAYLKWLEGRKLVIRLERGLWQLNCQPEDLDGRILDGSPRGRPSGRSLA